LEPCDDLIALFQGSESAAPILQIECCTCLGSVNQKPKEVKWRRKEGNFSSFSQNNEQEEKGQRKDLGLGNLRIVKVLVVPLKISLCGSDANFKRLFLLV